MNFTIEQHHNRSYLTYPLTAKDGTDPLLMGMLLNNRIPGFAPFSTRESDSSRYLCYDIHGLRSMKDVFSQTVSRHTLLNTFDRILVALESAQDYMIEASSVVLDPQYIFLDPTTFRMALICLPLMEYRNGNDEKSFFKSVMFNTLFDYSEPCDHVARIMNDLNSPEFSISHFHNLLKELGATESSSEAAPVFEMDFFSPDIPAPVEEPLAPIPSDVAALRDADAILSAALGQTEPPAAQAPLSFSDPIPTVTGQDPLSIADQLLSQALSFDPAPQEPTPAPVTHQAVPSAPTSDEAGSARSRRARARKETRDPQPPVQVPPVSEPIVAPPSPISDPIDFLDSFAPSASSKMTDAMRAADAILSALDLPTTDSKETPVFSFLSQSPAPSSNEEPLLAEDPFADFTTPIVTSRKKSGAAVPSKAEPRKTAVTPPAPQPQPQAEDPFDFSASVKKPSATTDAMKIADDLLSAALAGIAPAETAAPVNTSSPTVSPSENGADADPFDFGSFTPSSKKAADTDPFDFGSFTPASKKTAAMEQAAAILDSLDLFAPTQEESSTPVRSSAPSSEPVSEPLRQETSPQQEPNRKGGFFSKLRKKEDVPTPPVQAPVQPVTPYFGSDGETTVLNVFQQVAPAQSPYLIRSSNGETIILSKPVFRVGKDRDFVDYCIHDNSAISRRHANFMVRNGDIFIIDTNSTNHTYVNGVMIRSNAEIKLTHGDEIRLANEDFVLYCAGVI